MLLDLNLLTADQSSYVFRVLHASFDATNQCDNAHHR